MQSHSHLLCLSEKPSFEPMWLMTNSDMKPRVIPIHCIGLSRSENINNAPTSTMTGRVALTDPVMVSGRCLMAM